MMPALLYVASWTAWRPSMRFFSRAGRASYAVYMFAQYVSPPEGGTSSAYRIAPIGGVSTYVMSACQIASPSPRPPIGTPSFLMLEMTFISGCSARKGLPYGFGPG